MNRHTHYSLLIAHHSRRRRGHTLIELAATSVVCGIIVVGMASAMVIGSKALPEKRSAANYQLNASGVSERISNDLHYATSIITKTATDVKFTVPDRDGDNIPEIIEYVWTGTAGDSLIRKFNAQPDEEVLKTVNEFQLSYDCKTKTIPGVVGGNTESAEMLFVQQDSTNSGIAATSGITSTNWCAEYFRPTFGTEVLSWRITKVKILPSPNSTTDGTIKVQIRTKDITLKPTTTVLGEATLNESSFVSGQWAQADFASVTGLVSGTGYCVVIRYNSGSNTVANISYGTTGALSAATHFIVSTNTGGSWTIQSTNDLWMQVWGTVTTAGTTTPDTYQYWVKQINFGLRAGSNSADRIDTAVQIVNLPQVSSP